MSEVTAVRQPRTYSKNSPHSYFKDVAASTSPAWRGHAGAMERLNQHGTEVLAEVEANPTSVESRRVSREIRNLREANGVETRAATSSTLAGFTTPQYLLQDYRIYRENPPALLEQLDCQDPGDFGLAINIPTFGAGSSLGVQTEGSAISESSDPTTALATANLSTLAGQVTITQQLLDRGGPGPSFDKYVVAQMMQEYEAQADVLVITAITSAPQTISNSNTWGFQDLWSDIYEARKMLETYAGAAVRPTHVFFMPTPWAFYSSILGSDARPVIMAHHMTPDMLLRQPALMNGDDSDFSPAGFTGASIGGVPVFTDGNIPALASGADAQILVVNASSIVPFVTKEPVLRTIDQTDAGNLQVLVQLYGYAGVSVVRPKGVVQISGSAYSATPTFTTA